MKTPSLYQVPKLRHTTTTITTTTTTTITTSNITTTTSTQCHGGFQEEVLMKTPGLYQVPNLRNWISKNIQNSVDRPTDKISVTQSDIS